MGVEQYKNNNHPHESDKNKRIGGNGKAAKIADRLPLEQTMKTERWTDAIQAYSDYFIRY